VAIAIENVRLYEQIKTSENRYRTLFESAGTSLVIIDENQHFRLVNHAFELLSGYVQEELLGKLTLAHFLKGKDSKKKETMDRLIRPPQSWETEFTDKEGLKKQIHITTTLIPGLPDTLVSLIDMTRQRELERQLFHSEELAAIGELSAGIAHEIRNPLVAITTSASLLKDETHISHEGQQLLDVVKEEADHLAAIVDDFLQFARPKKPNLKKEDINKLVRDVIKRFKERNAEKINWVEQYGKDVPPIYIDRHQFQQIVTNLINNSLDAMADGGELKIKTQRAKRMDDSRIFLMITDSGIGIPEEQRSKIFQPFYSTKEKGTGMGLSICRRIVNEHDGEILVDSEPGKWTTFSVILPIQGKNNPVRR
jgi:two-component system NtrC family sensor kinase